MATVSIISSLSSLSLSMRLFIILIREVCQITVTVHWSQLAAVAGEVRDAPVALHIPVLTPCMSSEVLRIAVNVQTGAFMASVPACGQYCPGQGGEGHLEIIFAIFTSQSPHTSHQTLRNGHHHVVCVFVSVLLMHVIV